MVWSMRRALRSGSLAVTLFAGVATFAWHAGGLGAVPESLSDAAPMSREEAEGIIFERQQLMLELDEDTKTLGMIAAGSAPVKDLGRTTRAIAEAARESVTAFEQRVPGGRSTPEVWAQYGKFMDDMRDFARNAEEMAKAGEAGNLSAVVNLMIVALPCKQCHDRYRGPAPS
ncbi:MAG: cytochrome c [Novosphingobium sp.]